MVWAPYGNGHILTGSVTAGTSASVDNQPSSYNYVYVQPKWLIVDNLRNSVFISLVTSAGDTLVVPPAASKLFDMTVINSASIINSGNYSVGYTMLDARTPRDLAQTFVEALAFPETVPYALLAHFDNARYISDDVVSDLGITIDTTTSKFGDGSVEITSSSEGMIILDGALDTSVGVSIDFWVSSKVDLTGTARKILALYPTSSTTPFVTVTISNSRVIADATADAIYNHGGGVGYMKNTWRHIALDIFSMAQSTVRLFTDGTLRGTASGMGNPVNLGVIQLGLTSQAGIAFNVDELRIVRGRRFVSSTYTVPTAPYE